MKTARLFFVAIFLYVPVVSAQKAKPQRGYVTLAWNASTSTVTGYRIKYGTAAGKWDQQVDTGNVLQYTVKGLRSRTRYYFVCVALQSGLPYPESAPSNEVTTVAP